MALLTSQYAKTGIGFLARAKSVELYSRLGLGPRLHGIFEDAQGRPNIVMDIVPGDFPNSTNVTLATLDKLDKAFQILKEAGIEEVNDDFQFYITSDGNDIQVIDVGHEAAKLYTNSNNPNLPEALASGRAEILSFLPPNDAHGYLTKLRSSKPDEWIQIAKWVAGHQQLTNISGLNPHFSQRISNWMELISKDGL